MSLVKTDDIWLALGDFYDLFPSDERVYWDTFWDAYSDIVADLWGFAFQVDRAKSLFADTPTFERRAVLILISNLTKGLEASFRISRLYLSGGSWVLRGFVPRDQRTFKATDLPAEGLIRIGVDQVPYLRVNATTVVGGVYDGFVSEAVFTLASEPPHDYVDDPDFNDDFAQTPVALKLRVAHAAGGVVVDAVGTGTVNDSGVIQLGTAGVNAETVEYQSVIVTGNRYVFQLATGWQSPDSDVEKLLNDHANAEAISVYRHDPDRWTQTHTGRGRLVCNGQAQLVIDNEPTPVASSAELRCQYLLGANEDFDVSAAVAMTSWSDPVPLSGAKRVYVRLTLGSLAYVVGIETRRAIAGIEHVAIAGLESAPTETVLTSLPARVELRFARTATMLECQFRDTDSQQYQVLSQLAVSGLRGRFDLVLVDNTSQSGSRVTFDEVLRRQGTVVGNTRLEEFFLATATYPYAYDIDQRITEAAELRDRPTVHTESLVTATALTDPLTTVITGRGDGDDFLAQGVPDAGTLTIGGKTVLYDQIVRGTEYIEFHLRRKLDPDLFPIALDEPFTVATHTMASDVDFQLTGAGGIVLKDLPTRDRFWAPVARVDEQHVQKGFGKLVDLSATVSTPTYLTRVQGTWLALMDGAAFRNVHSGLQLAMGLPVAKADGTVKGKRDYRDALGKLVRRELILLTATGEVVHALDAGLYPSIDWSVDIGEIVDRFQPLTNGVQVWDVVADPLWHLRFPGVAEIERYNTFGIFVAIEALNAEASISDAVHFALRIKPTFTKMVMRFLLTSGDENLSEDLEDYLTTILVPHVCEDMTMPEGDPPADVLQILHLGEGHKLGQGKKLGGTGQWHPATLGTYARQGPFAGGQITDGSEIFEAGGGYSFVDAQRTTGTTTVASDVFSDSGAPLFASGDEGKEIAILDGVDAGPRMIVEVLSPTSVRVDAAFTATASGLEWQLRSTGFIASDLAKNIHIHGATADADNGDFKIVEIVDRTHVRLLRGWDGFETTETVTWELRDYVTLDDGETLGHYLAYHCHGPSANEPSETVDSEQIVTAAVSP
jgi:hypothetical protein